MSRVQANLNNKNPVVVRAPGEILADAVAKILVGTAFVAGIVIVLGVCALLRDSRPYGCWHRYWWY